MALAQPLPAARTSVPFGRASGLATLLIANVATIVFFVAGHASAIQALWVYWLQSVIIGAVNVARILLTPFQVAVPGTGEAAAQSASRLIRVMGAAFFAFHYGMFHVVYAIFLFTYSQAGFAVTTDGLPDLVQIGGSVSILAVLASGAIFALHHVMTFIAERRYRTAERGSPPSLGSMMSAPYGRILPMHLIIIFGPIIALKLGSPAVFVAFMAIKTVADVYLYHKKSGHPQAPAQQ